MGKVDINNDSEKLRILLSNVYQKSTQGASLEEVFQDLKVGLPNLLKKSP
ncbi:hypothetical protein [Paraliobacillus zengyii]|nr:hypothetical protein [Paraliobacillus zengyii]